MREGCEQQNFTEALWQFAVDEYCRPGVEPRCLELQDDFGLDVNILLAAVFSGRRDQRWGPALVEQLRADCEVLRDGFILPLRALRRKAKGSAPREVYESLQASELEMERWQLALLAACLGQHVGLRATQPCVEENLQCYGEVAAPEALPKLQELGRLFKDS